MIVQYRLCCKSLRRFFRSESSEMSEPVEKNKQEVSLGVKTQVWYLVNLLVLPGIGFLMVVWYYFSYRSGGVSKFALSHARGALMASLIGGASIVMGCLGLFFLVSDPQNAWPLIILYFTIMHSTFILWGILNVARAMAGKSMAPFGVNI